MILKRWFALLCLALMVVSEILLFAALRQKDAAQTNAQEAGLHLRQMQAELDELKRSNAGIQAMEINRLRKQLDTYTNRLAEAQTSIQRQQSEIEKLSKNLLTARKALLLQQQHLEELQTQNQMVTSAGLTILHRNACVNNLRQIDAAKMQWALDKDKDLNDMPRPADLLPYLKEGVLPACPDGGTYQIHNVESLPTCTIQGHILAF